MARYALVIGVGSNIPPLRSLSKTVKGAEAVADLLERQGSFVEVKRLIGDVTQAQLEGALQTLLQQQAERNEVLIYYTGHGFPLTGSFGSRHAYLAPSDCQIRVSGGQVVEQQRGISLEGLNELFREANLSNLVVLLECCYGGALLESHLVRETMTAFGRMDYFLIAACREFEKAYALREANHSIFTTALLRGLTEEKNSRGQVTTGRLFDFIYSELQGSGQEPICLGGGRSLALASYQFEVPESGTSKEANPCQDSRTLTLLSSSVAQVKVSATEDMGKDSSSDLELHRVLEGHTDLISCVAWSADGQQIASSSRDRGIRLWDIETGSQLLHLPGTGRSGKVASLAWSSDRQTIISGSSAKSVRVWNIKTQKSNTRAGHTGAINSVAFSPKGEMYASGSSDRTIRVCISSNDKLYTTLKGHTGEVHCIAWSPDGKMLASSSSDKTVKIWDSTTRKLLKTFHGHTDDVLSVVWSPDGQTIVSSSRDYTIRIWSLWKKRRSILEGHTSEVTSVCFSHDGRLLASKSNDGLVKLWRCDKWKALRDIDEPSCLDWKASIAFHPHKPVLATFGAEDTVIRIWNLDIDALLAARPDIETMKYRNAKVVLLGDTSVGKSGLRQVLTGNPFTATESTHGRYVQTLHSENAQTESRQTEMREVLLWDLAGQPSYRLIHQLHLNEVAVALIVVDSRSETDPFAGVNHWNRALSQAQTVQDESALPLKKFLVAARIDRGGIGVSRERIDKLVQDLGFDGYFETSAKEGRGIAELKQSVLNAIDWNAMSDVNSTDLFQETKKFLLSQKEYRRLLSSVEDLYYSFLETQPDFIESDKLYAQFETCIKLLESRGLLRKLSFGNLVLLQPELIDAYASAIVNTAKDEPEGMGSISESDARSGNFQMSEDERIKDREQEKLLLLATVEDLLRHEIALRDQDDLVFPSQFTREYPNASNAEGKSVTFTFEGAIQNIYSKLIVRLSRSTIYIVNEMWKNAALFSADVGGICGVSLNLIEDGKAELTLFFDSNASEETHFRFENYIGGYLQRQTLKGSVTRRRIFVCPASDCQEIIPDGQVQRRRDRGFETISCPICMTEISILDGEERLGLTSASNAEIISDTESIEQSELGDTTIDSDIDHIAAIRRKQDTAKAILQGKIETNDFDVFLAHNSQDKAQVEAIAEALRQRGLNPWIDKEQIAPGQWVQDAIQVAIVSQVKSAAVFISSNGMGRWQALELRSFIQQCVEGNLHVIPVLLPGADAVPDNLPFLKALNWVRFEESIDELDPLNYLEWGITGKKPHQASKSLDQLTVGVSGKNSRRASQALDRNKLDSTFQEPVENSRIKVFISYSHEDERFREELNIHLANLKRQGSIATWHDRKIEAGEEWDAQIKSNLKSAHIVLLLISPNFMASDYCYDLEMMRAIQRHEDGTARVIPIILRPTDWADTPFSKLRALPKDAQPITQWNDRDEAFLNVVQEIRRAIQSLQEKNW